jgi:hypothetical protein
MQEMCGLILIKVKLAGVVCDGYRMILVSVRR